MRQYEQFEKREPEHHSGHDAGAIATKANARGSCEVTIYKVNEHLF